jgi:endogenous inhibitor of DNA gyrase (YacG/DUF329 family)
MPKHSEATIKCPICKKATVQTFRPFCSKRCADVDLGRWLKGDYAIPSEAPVTEEEFDELPHPGRAN